MSSSCCTCGTVTPCTNGTISDVYLTGNRAGGNTQDQYSISGNAWASLTPATNSVAGFQPEGSQACSVSATFVVGGLGSGAVNFRGNQEYVVDVWTVETNTPVGYDDFSMLANLAGTTLDMFNTAQTSPFLTHHRYSIAGNSYSTQGSFPITQNQCQYGNLLDNLYFSGGSNSGGSIIATLTTYTIATDGYTTGTSLPAVKRSGSGFTFANYLHAACGVGPSSAIVLTNYRFQSSSWATKTAATNGHSQGASTSSLSYGYSMTGFDTSANQSTKTDQYDPVGDAWTNLTDTFGFREQPAAGGI